MKEATPVAVMAPLTQRATVMLHPVRNRAEVRTTPFEGEAAPPTGGDTDPVGINPDPALR